MGCWGYKRRRRKIYLSELEYPMKEKFARFLFLFFQIHRMQEVFEYLDSDREDVRLEAATIVSSLTSTNLDFFESSPSNVLFLMGMIKDTPQVAHQILTSLTNLSSKSLIVCEAMGNDAFIRDLIVLIILPQSILSDPACMLLNNISKSPAVIERLIDPIVNLDNLLEVFTLGDGELELKRYNPHASFTFLSTIFANISSTPSGSRIFLEKSTIDSQIRIARLALFISHTSLIKRGGVISAIKNICMNRPPLALFKKDGCDLLSHILAPLVGRDEYTIEEMDLLPEELQFNERDRETDVGLRGMLVDCLLAVGNEGREGRDYLRGMGVYRVLQKMHKSEESEAVREEIEIIVDLLERDEERKVEEIEDLKVKEIEEGVEEIEKVGR
jgi:hypothetical protein